jgi:TetR/AcrR family transcriptional repressor of nem operon
MVVMPRSSDKRERLIEAAKSLIHRRGFHRTTLADIAAESAVPLGNVYYYFKTKEDICKVVLEERKRDLERLLGECCQDQDPRANLKRFLRHLMADSDEVAECGCPHGTLSQELRKMSSPLTGRAEGTLQVLIDWAAGQFRRAGVARPKSTGFGFIARVQGTMMLTHALHDPKRLKQQFKYIGEWLDTL